MSEPVFDFTVKHQVFLQRLAESHGIETIKIIESSEAELNRYLTSRLTAFGPAEANRATVKKFDRMRNRVFRVRGEAMKAASKHLKEEGVLLAQNESKFATRIMRDGLDLEAVKAVSIKHIDNVINFGVFNGQALDEMYNTLQAADVNRIMQTVRFGVTQGNTTPSIMRSVRDGLNLTSQNAMSIARTFTNGVSNEILLDSYKLNSDVVKYQRYSATLDGATTFICISLDGQVSKIDDPAAPIPPQHHNCRSTIVPMLTKDDSIGTRPAANSDFEKDAERAYNARNIELGRERRWDDLAASTRDRKRLDQINSFEARTGKTPFRNVQSRTTYKTFFERQSAQFQKDVLGPTRYKLFRDGGLEIDKFVDFGSGRRFNLTQLRNQDIKMFDKIVA